MIFKRIKWQSRNLVFVIRTLWRVLLGRKNNKLPEQINKILIFQNAKMGDMVCTTPVFRAIKKFKPEIRVFVIGDLVNQELLRNHPDVDGYLVYKGYSRETLSLIEKEKFDVGLLVAPSPDGLATLAFSGIQFVVAPRFIDGSSPYETLSYKIMTVLAKKVPHYLGQYVPREYLRILEPIGINTAETKKFLNFSKEAEIKVLDFLSGHNLNLEKDLVIGITPSAGDKIKIWPADRFAEVADYLSEKHQAKILVFGSKHDYFETGQMKSLMKRAYIDATEKFDVDELKAFISKLSLVIAPDTGAIYIAEAFGVPTVDIVGPVNDNEQPPKFGFHKVAKASRQSAALNLMNNRIVDSVEAKRQIDDTTVSMVEKIIDGLLNELDLSATIR